jgi:hypothetical protein
MGPTVPTMTPGSMSEEDSVYILASKPNGTLYIGVDARTGCVLFRRVEQTMLTPLTTASSAGSPPDTPAAASTRPPPGRPPPPR